MTLRLNDKFKPSVELHFKCLFMTFEPYVDKLEVKWTNIAKSSDKLVSHKELNYNYDSEVIRCAERLPE